MNFRSLSGAQENTYCCMPVRLGLQQLHPGGATVGRPFGLWVGKSKNSPQEPFLLKKFAVTKVFKILQEPTGVDCNNMHNFPHLILTKVTSSAFIFVLLKRVGGVRWGGLNPWVWNGELLGETVGLKVSWTAFRFSKYLYRNLVASIWRFIVLMSLRDIRNSFQK